MADRAQGGPTHAQPRRDGTFVASTGPESEPGFDLLSKCRTGELVAALVQLPAVQLRRLLMHAVAQLPVKEIARREGCSERVVKYSLAKARRKMKEILPEGFPS